MRTRGQSWVVISTWLGWPASELHCPLFASPALESLCLPLCLFFYLISRAQTHTANFLSYLSSPWLGDFLQLPQYEFLINFSIRKGFSDHQCFLLWAYGDVWNELYVSGV